MPGAGPVSILAAGDIMLDTALRRPRIFYYQPDAVECAQGFAAHFRVPFVNCDESLEWLRRRNQSIYGAHLTSHANGSEPLPPPSDGTAADVPFASITALLRRSDVVAGNLECALTERRRPARNDACYRASPAYAEALAGASFSVVSLANNHAMDYGDAGLIDTVSALHANGVKTIGAGASLEDARAPAVATVRGCRIAFLGYSMIGDDSGFAVDGEAGVAPLNPMFVEQDIASARRAADCVIVSVHWGHEHRSTPFPRLIELAHFIADAGADAVLGHHPHVPGSIEIHRGKPILYSLGNFCFGHDHAYWSDDIVVELCRDGSGWSRIAVHAIAGRFQPAPINGERAAAAYDRLQRISEPFGTRFQIADGVAVVAS